MATDPFSQFYMGARSLDLAEKIKDEKKLKELDFAVAPQVRLVMNLSIPEVKLMF